MAEKTKSATAPVVRVSAEHWDEVLQATSMFPVLKAMRETTILAVTDEDITAAAEGARQVFGTRVVRVPAAALRAQYNRVGEVEAARWAEQWRRGARKVTNVSPELLVDNARMYLAISQMMRQMHAQTVAVNCASLRSQPGALPLPCMSHFQINNEGGTAVCTADVDVACAQTLLHNISRRPGILARPVRSAPGKGVTLSHMACTNRLFGPKGDANRYLLKNAEQEERTVYIQSLLPKNQPMTLVDLDLARRQIRIAAAEAGGGPEAPDGCQSCVFARTARDLSAAGSPPNRPCVIQFGAYARRAAFAAKLARIEPAGVTDVVA